MCEDDRRLDDYFEIFKDLIIRYAKSYVGDYYIAEDICQEVFLRWFEHAEPFSSEEHCRAWLIRVTLNCTSSLLSSSWFRRTVPLPETLQTAPQEETEVYSAVMRLSKTDRTVIHLYYYEDMNTIEIAKLMGTTDSTVRSKLSRARKRLKEILEGADQ